MQSPNVRLVTEAKFSGLMRKGFPALLAEQNGDRVITATNLVPSPRYEQFPSGWKYLGSGSGAVTGTTLSVSGTGAITGVGVYSDTMPVTAGHKAYIRVRMRTAVASASFGVSLSDKTSHVYVGGKAASVTSPPAGEWVTVSGVVTVPDTWEGGADLHMQAYQESAPAAVGRVVEFQPPLVLDLTRAYGSGQEPTAAYVDSLVADITGGEYGPVTLEITPAVPDVTLDDVRSEVSTATASLSESLGSRLGAVETSLAQVDGWRAATNLVKNGDFRNGLTGWNYYGSRGSLIPGAAAATGTGAITGVGLYTGPGYRTPAMPGHRIYVEARMRVRKAGATTMRVELSDGTTRLNAAESKTPGQDVWTTVAGIAVVPDSYTGKEMQVYATGYWPDAATANGATVEIDHVLALDLTEIYGSDAIPSLAEVSALVAKTGYFEGARTQFVKVGGAVTATEVDQRIDAKLAALPTPSPSSGGTGGHVVLRFDDGYVNNLTNAAEKVLTPRGMVGTIYTATHPTDWLGGSHGGHAIMTAAQLRELHQEHGWEIASHTRMHNDANNGDPNVWIENARQAAQDLVDAGLPWPRTLAYPNGGRNVVSDRGVYRLHSIAGLTGHPSLTPARRDEPTFFTGWATINGVTGTKADMDRAKAYVLSSIARGEVPVLGFHGITDGTPDAAHHLSLAHFTELADWLVDQGIGTIRMDQLRPHNMLSDPGFETAPFGFPWVAGAGWTRTRSTAAGHTGWMGADVASGGTGTLHQNVAVKAGESLRVRVRFGAGTQIDGGTLAVVAQPQTPFGAPVGTATTVGTVVSSTTEKDVTGTVTIPANSGVLRVSVVPSSFVGTARVVHAALYRADLYDPLA